MKTAMLSPPALYEVAMKKQKGFSLIEILVTMLLVSIGLLGMAALQGRTIGYTQDSIQRNTAAVLASDLLELIRANPSALASFYKASNSAFPSLPGIGCTSTPTSASDQLACWSDRAAKLLPGASALLASNFYICRSATPGTCSNSGSAVEIQIAWSVKAGECLDQSDSTTCTYRLRADI